MTEVQLSALTLDDQGRLFLDYVEAGVPRSLQVDLAVNDLVLLARYALHAAEIRRNQGSTLLTRMEAVDLF